MTEAQTETSEEESESESETEEVKKADFSAEADWTSIKVTLSESISEDASFIAKQYSVDSDYFANYAEDAVAQWIADHDLTVLDAVAYDMHFEKDGKELAVKQNAKVNMTFHTPILTEDAEIPTDVYALHVVNGQAKSVGTSISRD